MHWKTFITWAISREENPLTPEFAAECAATEGVVEYEVALAFATSLIN